MNIFYSFFSAVFFAPVVHHKQCRRELASPVKSYVCDNKSFFARQRIKLENTIKKIAKFWNKVGINNQHKPLVYVQIISGRSNCSCFEKESTVKSFIGAM